MSIRLVDAGLLPAIRSQTVYHAVARCFDSRSSNTIILARPEAPGVCIGFHQDLKQEVDYQFCRRNGLPVIRRQLGGGAVYLDTNQLFTQWVFRPQTLPMQVVERFRMHASPIVSTYRSLGIKAEFQPINDILVAGKKISGLGAGRIGAAEVVVGNFLWEFDFQRMSEVLNIPDPAFRRTVLESLRQYLTTVKQELGFIPDRQVVKKHYITHCEKVLRQDIVEGRFSDAELEKMQQLDEKFSSDEWIHQPDGYARPAIKIHSRVWVGKTGFEMNGDSIEVVVRIQDNHIDAIEIGGNDTSGGRSWYAELTASLLNAEILQSQLTGRIEKVLRKHQFSTAYASGWAESVVQLADSIRKN